MPRTRVHVYAHSHPYALSLNRLCHHYTAQLTDKAEDKGKFEKAWARLAGEVVGVEVRVLTGAAELARRYPEKPKQLNEFKSVDDLIAEAAAAEEAMHTAMRALVESVGGRYDRGPLKKKPRILEKMYADVSEAEWWPLTTAFASHWA